MRECINRTGRVTSGDNYFKFDFLLFLGDLGPRSISPAMPRYPALPICMTCQCCWEYFRGKRNYGWIYYSVFVHIFLASFRHALFRHRQCLGVSHSRVDVFFRLRVIGFDSFLISNFRVNSWGRADRAGGVVSRLLGRIT